MVTQVQAGTAYNVVPVAGGRLRGSNDAARGTTETAHLVIRRSRVKSRPGTVSCRGDDRSTGEPVLVNDAALAERAAELLSDLGHAVDRDFRSFGSDDFAATTARMRGLMMFVGTGAESGGLHDPSYLPDDRTSD